MRHNFEWLPRYSQTEGPDKKGRWARLCYYKGVLICWINKVEIKEGENKGVKYIVKDMYPSSGSDNPFFVGVESTGFDKAKKDAENRFLDFLSKIH